MGQVEDWVNAVDHHLAQLKHLLPDDFPLDFSSASLQRLELVAIERYDSLEALGGDDGPDGFLQGVLAYDGEAVLRVVGGSWMWDYGDKHGATSHPIILLDERLGFPAMSVAPPYLLLVDALETRDGKAVERVYSSMQEVAQERRAEAPSWTPMRKPPTDIAATAARPSEGPSARPSQRGTAPTAVGMELLGWVERLEERLGCLKEIALPDEFPFDHSVGSLKQLETLALARYPDGRALRDAAGTDMGFIDGFAAYVGDTLLKVAAGTWGWDHNPEQGLPPQAVVQPDKRLDLPAVWPLSLLSAAVNERSGRVLADAHAALQSDVAAWLAEDPGWFPVDIGPLGVDWVGGQPVLQRSSIRTHGHEAPNDVTDPLKEWVLGVWVLLHALKVKELVPDDFGLDFSRGSLERLEALAVQRSQTSQDTPLDVPGRSSMQV